MKRVLPASITASAILIVAGSIWPVQAQNASLPKLRASVARAPGTAEPAAATYNWTGAYVGFNTGAALGTYDTSKTTTPSPTYLSNPANIAAVNAAGQQQIKRSGFIGGVQAGYNWQLGRALFGIEADLNYLHMGGATTSGAVRYPVSTGFIFTGPPPRAINQFIVYSYADADWLLTLRPRAGITADNWLFYATGGLALTRLKGQSLFTDGNALVDGTAAVQEADVKTWKAGYTVGGGVETAISNRLRFKAEYSFVDFPTVQLHETSNNLATFFVPPASQTFSQSMKLQMHLFRLGLNYRFSGTDSEPPGSEAWASAPSSALLPWPTNATRSDWEFEVGARTWFSSGTVGAPQALLAFPPLPSSINSRLTYENVQGLAGETFAGVDHRSGAFVKGFLGAGGITGGTLVDEDFPGGSLPDNAVYSNTRSPLKGNIGYANIDVGYNVLAAPGAKVGAFVGYNYYTQHFNGFGCNQVTTSFLCVGADPNYQVFGEDERYDSLRVGLAAEFMLTDRLKLSAEAAYLPWVRFRAQDDHNYRQLFILESSNHGDGAMLEGILSYAVTSNWNIGLGGRYWAMNMHDGNVLFDQLGFGILYPPQVGRYNSERHGFFLQTNYKWGDVTRPAEASADAVAHTAPMNWTGFYAGGHVGGAFADNRWSDPFPSARTGTNFNSAGFGDTVYSNGPLAGGQAGFNWQIGPWVLGLQGAWSKTDLRGENTCYSGVGGLNCQNIINSVGTVTGRLGYAWDRVLIYAEGGGARARIDYALLGDTAFQNRGYGVTRIAPWGWVVGGGLEYAITDRWTTTVDYQHVDLGTNAVPFPTVALVRLQDNTIRQTVDLFKLGVNYKFDWPDLPTAQN